MESRISIKVDFERNTPYIQIIQRQSDDTRDDLIKVFGEKLGGDSSWGRVYFEGISAEGHQTIRIEPITPDQIESQANGMLEQARLRKEWKEKMSPR